MKRTPIQFIGLGLITAALQLNAAEATVSPLDPAMFKLPASASGEEYVEVNISRSLISLVNRAVAAREPEIATVLDELRGIRVHVVSLDDTNRRGVLAQLEKVRTTLTAARWESVATVKDGDTTVHVLLKLKGDEAVEGLVVEVIENGDQAVLVGIDGNIRPEQVGMLGERFNIEPLKGIGLKLKEH
ncbi:MAG: DUF4252 domain-containing protein [Verrucomicrobiae bacterium]|nr:DUF4252 domain-containing protein [Verrucomicrobiae bacterium]MCP5523479.1 DUF4252 domain-containing protein [Verrucomicrobiales bacterium]